MSCSFRRSGALYLVSGTVWPLKTLDVALIGSGRSKVLNRVPLSDAGRQHEREQGIDWEAGMLAVSAMAQRHMKYRY
jgi:hypothetical protein